MKTGISSIPPFSKERHSLYIPTIPVESVLKVLRVCLSPTTTHNVCLPWLETSPSHLMNLLKQNSYTTWLKGCSGRALDYESENLVSKTTELLTNLKVVISSLCFYTS